MEYQKRITIQGKLQDTKGQNLAQLRIEAWDNDLLFDDFVGESITDSDGRFEISFTQAHYRELFFDNRPDLYFKIYQDGKMIHSTENAVLWNIDSHQQYVEIIIELEGNTNPQEEDLKFNFFKVHLKSQKLLEDFEKLYKTLDRNWFNIKQELIKNRDFSPELIQKLEFINELADWGNNNELLVSLFENESQTNSMREIALQFNKEEFIFKVERTAPVDKNKIEYAEKLYEQLFFIEPTAMLINMGKDSRVPILNDVIGRNIISVLEKQPDFNMKTTSVYELLNNEELLTDISEELKNEVKSQLKIMQRIVVLSPNPVAIPALYNRNFYSASQIASLPGEQFTTMMSREGLGENITKQLHANAQQIVARNEQTLISLKEVYEGTGIECIDRSLDVYDSEDQEPIFYQRETEYIIENREELSSKKNNTVKNFLKKNNLSWDLLFGDSDYCECGECTSVYSPAAYYVELLQYLRNNNLDPEIKSQKGINGTPLEKLFQRRPDLGCLELTCKNTNTILPYVDLVNEVMENFLVHKRTKTFNVKDETSGELLSEPQHTDQEAYSILSEAVYPMTLPYHQPIDAARIYLNQLGTSRHELIDIFGKNIKDQPNRTYDAEFLGLTEQEYIILTKESFTEKKDISKTKYESKIVVKPVYEYYGYKSESELLGEKGLKNIKNEFLKRTGIDYVNLVDLLKTEYLNPNTPKGKSKVIMERISDDYSYLEKKYNNSQGADNLKDIIYEQINDSVINVSENEEIPTCEKNTSIHEEISKYNVDDWVDNEFEKIGKLIVIESGSTNINGKIILKHARPVDDNLILKLLSESIVENYDILVKTKLQNKGDIPINEFSKIGSIDKKTGKVTLIKGPDPRQFSAFFEQLIFISEKGEKSVFEVFRNEIFLIIEKKDTCNLNTSVLQHLDGSSLSLEEYDRIHRFIRLWRKLGWTIDETDKAIVGLSKNTHETEFSFDINTNLINQLVSVKKLLKTTGLELIKLLTLWTDISTVRENSLYQRLFLTHNLVRLDSVFNPDEFGNFLNANVQILDHKPVLMAALNLSSQDIDIVVEKLKLDGKLTLQNISKIYRYRLLSKLLGFPISEFVDFPLLFGNIFENAKTTLSFIETWSKLEDVGFSYLQIQYIIKNLDNIKKPLKPSLKEVLFLTKAIYDGLNSIEETHKDLSGKTAEEKEEEATSELVISKINLLLEPTVAEKIIEFIEGNTTYSTKTVIPVLKEGEKITLNDKLLFYPAQGTIQIKGILTTDEITKLNALSNDLIWIKGIDDIKKQQDKLYKELFTDNFNIDPAIEKIIKEGDIVFGELKARTAPKKRLAFLNIFLPYLRKELSHRFIIDILAKETGLEEKFVDLLVTKILKDTSTKFIYQTFLKIKEQNTPQENNWKGYLIPNKTGVYRFVIRNTDQSPDITLDGVKLTFIKENDINEWWNHNPAEIELEAGKLYTFSSGTEIQNIYWKTSGAPIAIIPTSALIPDFATADCIIALNELKKAAIVTSAFKLSIDEIRFFNSNQGLKIINFNELKLSDLLKLESYTRLRNSLPKSKLNLLDFFRWIGNKTDNAELSDKITELTGWKNEIIKKLIQPTHFNLSKDDFKDEIQLLKLQKAIEVVEKIGIDIDKLFNWTNYTSTEKPFENKFHYWYEIATSLKNTIRSKYNQTDWEQVIKPSHDQLRNNQKDALIACLLQKDELRKQKIYDADGLFEFFLIDVQMDAVMETSRIKQAIASVQLFVQRCFLGLEEENKIPPYKLDRPCWEWMQRYRLWEANRKVFLYPENWIETNLRDDKSPFFKELESELLQKDINKQNVADALKSYLYKVDEVANMEVIGLYIEGEKDRNAWFKGAKLHVFSRTRNTPSFFYYRYLALDEMNWYPWEKMDVDITSYDFEDAKTHEIKTNGCYLSPVVWNDRLLIFFPQIVKKTRPNEKAQELTIAQSVDHTSQQLKPIEYHEIKMAWSEYRNGKWTQKQISKNSISYEVTVSPSQTDLADIRKYIFIPQRFENSSSDINIEVFYSNYHLSEIFIFNGNAINVAPFSPSKKLDDSYLEASNFHYWENILFSLQYFFFESPIKVVNPLSLKPSMRIQKINQPFFNDYPKKIWGNVNLPDLEEFFANNTEDFKFGLQSDSLKATTQKIYHELKDPYSIYNWELFFHIPMALADSLSKAQQFEEAMKWYHYVFNPVSKEGFDDKRFWQFSPFKEINSKNILETIFNQLQPNTPDQAINEWRNKPFMPHVVARSRPVAYMKWVVMKYIDNLIAWGDHLFRQDTIETINQATQLYVLAGHILGPRPMMIPKKGKTKPQTYLGLLNKWDAYGNAMSELELVPPFSSQTAITGNSKELPNTTIFGQAGSLYFCIPKNPKLIAYWDTIGDRLFKIRHSQNIEGVFRKMPLFEPPIDPALLVKAAAEGLSIASVLNDLNTPMPNYRFYYLLQKALELCNELKSLGGALLSAFEKKDNETIAIIRSKHENVMNNLMMEIKKKQLDEAHKNLESLEQNRKAPEERMKYYLQLSGMEESLLPDTNTDFSGIANTISTVDGDSGLKLNAFEKEDMDKASDARDWQGHVELAETLASILHMIPVATADAKPFGIGAGFAIHGQMFGNAAQAVAKGLQGHVSSLSFASTSAGKKGNFSRAMQDRIQQANAAGYELKQIDKQITAQKIRIEIANQEIANQQQLMDNSLEVEEFLKNKFTNEELYTWMRGSLKTLYHQVYGLTYELAKKAEKVYQFERGISNSSFIQSGYWDAGRNGLLAGEQLYVGLKQMEAAYQNERGYDYEITKHVSLQQIDPMALILLRETGKCEFDFPEVLFDMDYSGHYKRRIKSVSISIPCVVGPYTGVNAILRLLENKFRNTAIGNKYEESIDLEDDRFSRFIIPITAIATSSAQNDSGMFELNFKDERYLPFEGAGVISKWRLELPQIPQFNYQTISDVIIHLKYTSSEGGEKLKLQANTSLLNKLSIIKEEFLDNGLSVLINIKQDFPNEWHLLKKNAEVNLTIDKSRLPYMVLSFDNIKIQSVVFAAKIKNEDLKDVFSITTGSEDVEFNKIENLMTGKNAVKNILLDTSFKLKLSENNSLVMEELFMVVNYTVKK